MALLLLAKSADIEDNWHKKYSAVSILSVLIFQVIQIFEIAAPLAKNKANQTEHTLIVFGIPIFLFSYSPIFLLNLTCKRVDYHIKT